MPLYRATQVADFSGFRKVQFEAANDAAAIEHAKSLDKPNAREIDFSDADAPAGDETVLVDRLDERGEIAEELGHFETGDPLFDRHGLQKFVQRISDLDISDLTDSMLANIIGEARTLTERGENPEAPFSISVTGKVISETEDGGQARIAQIEGDGTGFFVRLQSWHPDKSHPVLSKIEGKTVRVTIKAEG